MVYLKVGDQYADGCFGHLKEFLRIIDCELFKIKSRIDESADPDSDGIYDLYEYMIGYGFVAIQRYMISTYPHTHMNKSDCFKHGRQLEEDLYLMEALNAGANYWKHEPEWPFSLNVGSPDANDLAPISINRSGDNLEKNSKGTYGLITKLTEYSDYTLSNLLAVILERVSQKGELSFSSLLPFIEQWRNDSDSTESLK